MEREMGATMWCRCCFLAVPVGDGDEGGVDEADDVDGDEDRVPVAAASRGDDTSEAVDDCVDAGAARRSCRPDASEFDGEEASCC